MNERIEKLAEQAWRATSDEVAHLNRMHNRAISHDEQMDIFEQKFAELIVQECTKLTRDKSLSIVERAKIYAEPDADEIDAAKATAWQFLVLEQQMKKHFGVE